MGWGRKVKLAAGGGCALLVLAVIAVLGSATWYAAQFSKEYRAVQESEAALVEATHDFDSWGPPPEGVDAVRFEKFLAVREALAPDRAALAAATAAFEAGGRGLWSRLSGGADLVPAYAAFWSARNGALLERGIGPLEYVFTYRLAYYGFLGRDPLAGAETEVFDPGDASWLSPWVDPIPEPTRALLESRRGRLEATWDPDVNPLELIFDGLQK
jgi:hypothetical protein